MSSTSDGGRLDVATYMNTLIDLADPDTLSRIERAEAAFHDKAIKMHGFVALANAFKSLFLETVNLSHSWQSAIAPTATYAWLLPRMAGTFHTLCGAEREALLGYAVPAFGQLRNVFDTAVVTAAVGQNFVTYEDAEGTQSGEPFDPNKIARRSKRAEIEINSRMVGKNSGLSSMTLHELDKLNKLYDFETHGQRMTATRTISWMKGEAPLSFLPDYDQMNYALFINRYTEVAWMVHRLVPLMWPVDVITGNTWHERWATLDKCFRQTVESMTIDLKKAVGQAIVEFVSTKFPFNIGSRLAS